MRCAEIKRKTNETDISLTLDLDGKGTYEVKSGSGFLDHMLELFAKHVKGIKIKAAGGIKSVADAEKFMDLGADRLGTSSLIKYLKS